MYETRNMRLKIYDIQNIRNSKCMRLKMYDSKCMILKMYEIQNAGYSKCMRYKMYETQDVWNLKCMKLKMYRRLKMCVTKNVRLKMFEINLTNKNTLIFSLKSTNKKVIQQNSISFSQARKCGIVLYYIFRADNTCVQHDTRKQMHCRGHESHADEVCIPYRIPRSNFLVVILHI